MNNPLEPIYEALEQIQKLEDHYYDCAYKAMEKNNTQAHCVHTGEATAFQRARYILEDALAKAESEVKDGVE